MHYKSFVTFLRAGKESYVIMYLKYLNLHQYHAGFRFLFTYEMKLREPYTSGRDRRDTVDRLFKPQPAGINLVPSRFSPTCPYTTGRRENLGTRLGRDGDAYTQLLKHV